MTAKIIAVRFTFEGFHRWPGAPEHRSYLANRHRHLFHVEARMSVKHNEREVEFHDFLEFCGDNFWLGESDSCETAASALLANIEGRWPGRAASVQVWEDGEVGAIVANTDAPKPSDFYRISKEFHFSAAHQLSHLPEGHPCKRLHGHNYIVEVVLEGEALDNRGFVTDYNDLHTVKEYIDGYLDHRNLNDVLECYTTAENIARHLFDKFVGEFPTLAEVRVSETPKTWASYRRAG